MLTNTQLLIMIYVIIIFLYAVIDRICKCVENTRNPMGVIEKLTQFLKNVNNDNGNKSV